ncbi:helix-turn-helix domain-containing protein [Umezawaea endophytica]|uniref:Helix-turn-helix domain-containing protein n=1 Tax=Umezawaea endophytica TaxID=1654476 RepID=A0A9X3AHQ0_9PSEU|nr:helix-turn-helix transcriptional regulator [Umezawaea endophytica]MCS7481847.1 helix-turn-helix domain-containing protein [Umezawaea endophytica]
MEEDHHSRPATARTRELGQELRLARKRANLKATAVAEELGWSLGKLSKLEHGWRSTSDWDYGTLLGKLGADQATRKRIQLIVAEQDTGHFLRPHHGLLSDNLLCLMIHERAATTMCHYETTFIPGLLQTEAYARAVIDPDGGFLPEELTFKTNARLERQTVLIGLGSPEATFYIHEVALHAVVGDNQVMHDQMMRLAFMCGWGRLTIRVVPMSRGGHPALMHAFASMTFAKPITPVAYSETDVATVFTEDRRSIEIYQHKQRALDDRALNAEQSRSLFARWADTYDRRGDRDVEGPGLA